MTEVNPADNDPKLLWRNIRITALAMTIMSAIFLLVALIVCESVGPIRPEVNEYRKWLLPLLAVLAFVFFLFARSAYQKEIVKARGGGGDLVEKMTHYRSAVITHLAIIEGIVIFGSILFLFTADFSYLAFSAVIIGFMAANLPRKNRMAELLQLDGTQLAQLS